MLPVVEAAGVHEKACRLFKGARLWDEARRAFEMAMVKNHPTSLPRIQDNGNLIFAYTSVDDAPGFGEFVIYYRIEDWKIIIHDVIMAI